MYLIVPFYLCSPQLPQAKYINQNGIAQGNTDTEFIQKCFERTVSHESAIVAWEIIAVHHNIRYKCQVGVIFKLITRGNLEMLKNSPSHISVALRMRYFSQRIVSYFMNHAHRSHAVCKFKPLVLW